MALRWRNVDCHAFPALAGSFDCGDIELVKAVRAALLG
jgi:hypothetical protein